MMQYKGYTGKVEFDDEAEIFHGEVIGLRDVITFQGKTLANSWSAFHPICTVRFTSLQKCRDRA